MAKVLLIIKGNATEAVQAASRRSVEMLVANYVEERDETRAYADQTELSKIMRWLGESDRAPFAAGALLFFNPIPSDALVAEERRNPSTRLPVNEREA